MNSFIKTQDFITVVFEDGESATVYQSDSYRYDKVVSAVRRGDWVAARAYAFPASEITNEFKNSGLDVELRGDVVYYKGEKIHNCITDKIVELVDQGFNVTHMLMFLDNLLQNPSYRAVNELYGFMEHSQLPITDDGHLVAYKRIRSDYTDIYTGDIDNSIGAVVEMPRNMVDDNKDNVCSRGLHFCSREYLSYYGTKSGNRTVVVKINPRDVVSIPSDYNNAKGRCCRYEVVAELQHKNEQPLENAPVWDAPTQRHPENTTVVCNPPTNAKICGVIQVDNTTGRVINAFSSVLEASNATGTNESSIRKVCAGRRITAGGFRWMYLHESHTDYNSSQGTINNKVADTLQDLSLDYEDTESVDTWY